MVARPPRFLRTALALLVILPGCGGGGGGDEAGTPSEDTTKERAEIATLVEDVVSAYGGEKRLGGIRSYRLEAVISSATDRTVGETVRWFQRPDRLRVELRYPDRGEIRVTRGKRSRVGKDDRTLEPAPEPLLGTLRLQAARMDLPLLLVQDEETLVLMPADEKGRPVLRALVDVGLTLDCHVDRKSHRIERVTMQVSDSAGPLTFAVDLEEFRWVDGVLFPFKEVLYTNGTRTAEVRIREIDVNPEVAEEMFGP